MEPERTPQGDEIVAHTMWLEFPEGEIAVSMDATKFVAEMKRAQAACERLSSRLR